MRKRYKIKKRSCGVCKPHKKGGAPRWDNRELVRLKEYERERQSYLLR